jgi:hypothetical protein
MYFISDSLYLDNFEHRENRPNKNLLRSRVSTL